MERGIETSLISLLDLDFACHMEMEGWHCPCIMVYEYLTESEIAFRACTVCLSLLLELSACLVVPLYLARYISLFYLE